jgi:hypothetical protein
VGRHTERRSRRLKPGGAIGHVKIEHPRFSLAGLLRHPAHRAEIELTRAVPWSLVLAGGPGNSSVDLRGLELRALEIAVDAGNVRIVLPAPRRVVHVRIGGGASKLTVLHPEQTAVGPRIAGGPSRLAFEGQRYGATGGETRHESEGDTNAAGRYEIEITGGASELTVAEGEDQG